MAPARQQPAPPPFSKDEKVLCFHMDMLYEAKIMDVQPGEKPSDGYKYKVHYKGWKNTWDDWVLVDRIRPFDDEHKELAAQLHAQLKHNIQRSTKQPKKGLRSGAESARVSEERSGSATVQGGRGGRRGKDWELEQGHTKPYIVIQPPPASNTAYGAAVFPSMIPFLSLLALVPASKSHFDKTSFLRTTSFPSRSSCLLYRFQSSRAS
ncbi:hypothetical protein FNYG_10913 [Fusarium nygamai]|uniref:Chromatin modification-related protein EAF3 n=1 Tax=Gibberella nygamai TaxID=42673 RepID=A0A2K0W0N4_GIBNY|nr:hypothetical protein FNYG_10913 [Fusarium nygamai]